MNREVPVTGSYKVGLSKGRPRIWIDGKKLAEAGFVPGTDYNCQVTSYCIRCTLGEPLRDVTSYGTSVRRVSGRPSGKPIIDIVGADIERAFLDASRVMVLFTKGMLTITREA